MKVRKVLAPTRRIRSVRAVVEPGFTWTDPVAGHVVACGDARNVEFVRGLVGPDEVRLSLVDPPYNLSSDRVIGFETRSDMTLNEDWDRFGDDAEFAVYLGAIVNAASALSRGNVGIWTSDWWLSDVKRWLRKLGRRVWPTYHWCKPNPAPSVRKSNPSSAVEYLTLAGHTADGTQFFDISALPKQRNYFVALPEGEFAPAVSPHWVERAVVSQHERIKRTGTRRDLNATQKPLDLVEAFVRSAAPVGSLVLDSCGGTGTTLIAADRSGRRCVYVDQDPEQVRAAVARLTRDRSER